MAEFSHATAVSHAAAVCCDQACREEICPTGCCMARAPRARAQALIEAASRVIDDIVGPAARSTTRL